MIQGGEVTYIEPKDVIGTQGAKIVIDGVEIEFMFAPGEVPTSVHFYFPRHQLQHYACSCYMSLHDVCTVRGRLSTLRHAIGRQCGALTIVREHTLSCSQA